MILSLAADGRKFSNLEKAIQWLFGSIFGAIMLSACYIVPEQYLFLIFIVFVVPTSWPVLPAVYFTLRIFKNKPSGREKAVGWLIISVLVLIVSFPCYMLFRKYFPADSHSLFFAPTLICIMYATYLISKLKK